MSLWCPYIRLGSTFPHLSHLCRLCNSTQDIVCPWRTPVRFLSNGFVTFALIQLYLEIWVSPMVWIQLLCWFSFLRFVNLNNHIFHFLGPQKFLLSRIAWRKWDGLYGFDGWKIFELGEGEFGKVKFQVYRKNKNFNFSIGWNAYPKLRWLFNNNCLILNFSFLLHVGNFIVIF